MSVTTLTRVLFIVAAVYDGILGALFLFAPTWPFRMFGITEPNHPGYVQFPGALLMIFAAMFTTIARDPARYRHLIPFGILLKFSYCGLAFWYWIAAGIPGMWKTFAILDLITGLLFAWSFVAIGPASIRTVDKAS
jgi:hypothetical protein